MSKDFIESKHNSKSLSVARRQYQQLSYFTLSEISEEVNEDYYKRYVERRFSGNDIFLNWVKNIFKERNFLSFAKYYKTPNPSSKLANTRIKETLSRVFFSEDSHYYYFINNKKVQKPKELDDDFEEDLFNAVLFRYNDVIVHDLYDINKPFREFVSIDNIVSIEVERKSILRIAYTACIKNDLGEKVYGYAYIDNEKYKFYDKERRLLNTQYHDLGFCPATFVVNNSFKNDEIVKESIFTYLKAEMEEYCFLKTLQRMVDANGTLPIAVKYKIKIKNNDIQDFDAQENEPLSALQIGSQVSKETRSTIGTGEGVGSDLQAGSVLELEPVFDDDGKLQTDFAKNFVTFHYAPIEALDFLNKRVKDVEKEIIVGAVGEYYSNTNNPQGSKSEQEIMANDIVAKQDKLRYLSNTMSKSRNLSDRVMLGLAYGIENVDVDVFYGSDFFLESQEKLYKMYKETPNPIERKNILLRLSQTRNIYNKDKSKRETILYKILPYTSDKDFETASSKNAVSEVNFELQTRFSYWIDMFESIYGDVVVFWNDMGDRKDSDKIIEISNHLSFLVNEEISNRKILNESTKEGTDNNN